MVFTHSEKSRQIFFFLKGSIEYGYVNWFFDGHTCRHIVRRNFHSGNDVKEGIKMIEIILSVLIGIFIGIGLTIIFGVILNRENK